MGVHRILMVLDNYYPPDIRVSKEAAALIKNGFNVNLICWGKEGCLEKEVSDKLNIFRRVKVDGFKKIWSVFNYYVNFVNPVWFKELDEIVRELNIEVIHVHDLPLVKTCIKVAEKYDIPVIADLHENYPEAVKDWMSSERGLKSRLYNLFMPFRRWRKYERSVLQKVSRIITIVEETAEHYVKDCMVPAERITLVRNTDLAENLLKYDLYSEIIEKYNGYFVTTYIGAFGPHRGLEIILKAASQLVEKIPELKILIVGGGGPPSYENTLKSLVTDLNLEGIVEFTGWVNYTLIPTYIYISNICLIPYKLSNHTNDALPHKLFQYMAFSKPVVATRTRTFSRVVEGHNCGLLFPSEDYKALAECILKLYEDRNLALEMGRNGFKAVREHYNWHDDERRLLELYNKIFRL